ncbi:MAG: TRAP transporter substrate-binding protein [Deltaproteobacteria bacterium]|nr:TRAP transporter substrate-binding protein [Deltaproteobacteria bacterium]
MKNWKWVSLCVCLAMIGFSSFASPAFVQAKTIKLSYSNFFPPTHKHAVYSVDWANEIAKRTNGRVKITVHTGGTLTKAPQVYDGVVKGISDIGYSVLAYTRGRFPLMEVVDLPLGSRSGYASTKLINEFNNKFKPKELADVKVMYLHCHGPAIYHTKKPINKLEDIQGMKIRCTGLATKIVTMLGGTPVAMPMPETYDSLARGVVDGTLNPQEALQGFKFGEVVKFTTESYGSTNASGFFIVMNKDKWNALPGDIQKIIEEVNKEWADKTGKLWDDLDKAGRAFTLKLGNKIISLSKEENERWAKAVKPIFDDYLKRMKEKGLPGEEALKFCVNRLKELQ